MYSRMYVTVDFRIKSGSGGERERERERSNKLKKISP
jgi:hypothetical protein